jgi:hypothetical protein
VKMNVLDDCTNCFGDLNPELRGRLYRVLGAEPTQETWDDAYSIIVAGGGVTLWQAWVAIDSRAPTLHAGGAWNTLPGSNTLHLAIIEAHRAVAEGRWRVGSRLPGWLVAA